MLHLQSYRLTVLKQIQLKYGGSNCPASYKDIDKLEDPHNICNMVYEIEHDHLILSKEGTNDYIQNDIVYILNKDYYENADYLGRTIHSMFL